MYLGIDLGTTNVKAVLADAGGRIRARGSSPLQLLHTPDGGIEQDIEEIWSAAIEAVRQIGATADLAGVRSLGVSAQGGALQLLDAGDRPVGRVISWLDGRGRARDEQFTRRLGADWFAAHTGHGAAAVAVGQIARLAGERTRPLEAIGFVGDVIVGRLCGRRAHDATSLSIATLHNPSLRRADPDLLRELNVGEEQLPALLTPTTPAGDLSRDAAAATGLPAGVSVSAAIHDQYAAALGAGVIRAGDVMFGAGTAWVLLAIADRLRPPAVPEAFVCTHIAGDLYGQMLSMTNGGSSFGWALEALGLETRNDREIDDMLASVAPGSEGLRFRPLLAPGGGAGLAPGTRGQLHGLHLSHAPAAMLRAVVEGLCCELARYLDLLRGGGIGLARLVMCGGAAASEATPQIVADVTGLPVSCSTEPAMSALGAAVLGRRLAEPDSDLAALADGMKPEVRERAPGRDAPRYRALLEEYVSSLPKT